MPRFFFHLRGDREEGVDVDGIEAPDVGVATQIALTAARDVMCGDLGQGRLDLRLRIDVEDENGITVHSLAFVDAFTCFEDSSG